MISLFSVYIKNIIFFLIFISFIGIILPNSKYKSYITLLLGVILIIVIITPVFDLISPKNFDTRILGMQIDLDKNLYEKQNLQYIEMQEEMIINNYKIQIMSQLESIVSKHNFQIIDLKLDFDKVNGEIFQINLHIKDKTQKVEPTKKPIIRIERVNVNPLLNSKEVDDGQNNPQIKIIKNMISDFYNLSVENIYVKYETEDIN